MEKKRVFETELVEGKDLSGSSKWNTELSTLFMVPCIKLK